MTKDLIIIKKLYGEDMMKFCRENLAVILEEEGRLPELLQSLFAPNKSLLKDVKEEGMMRAFIQYILTSYKGGQQWIEETDLDPFSLMKKAGYDLVECKSEKDVKAYIKYYTEEERLCSFNDIKGRLGNYHIFFATKKNIDEIKRENFKNPKRQDEYGVSCISLQFTKDENSLLSIKNRYNHTVDSPDATYSNNLENIIPGLTYSYEKYLACSLEINHANFELKDYVTANDGRYYKGNYEINGIWYLSNNKIVENGNIIEYDPNEYLLIDYFLLCKNKDKGLGIKLIDGAFQDAFYLDYYIYKIANLSEQKYRGEDGESYKNIILTNKDGNKTEIVIDMNNRMVEYKNNWETEVINTFLQHNKYLRKIEQQKLSVIGDDVLKNNEMLISINLPKLEKVGMRFLLKNKNFKDNKFKQNLYQSGIKKKGKFSQYFADILKYLNSKNDMRER